MSVSLSCLIDTMRSLGLLCSGRVAWTGVRHFNRNVAVLAWDEAMPGGPSISGDTSIGTRICRPFQHAIAIPDNRPGMTGCFIVCTDQFDVMTALLQVGNGGSRNSAFELECIAALSPGSAK